MRLLKRIELPQGAPPPTSPRLQQIILAAGDRRAPKLPLIIKNLSPAGHHRLHHLLSHYAKGALYAATIDATKSADLDRQIERLTGDLGHIDRQEPCTLHLFWKGEAPSSSDGALSLLLGGLGSLKASKAPGKVALPPGLDESADDAPAAARPASRKKKDAPEPPEPDSEDEPSWEGHVRDLLKTLRARLPRAKVVLMTPHAALRAADSLPRCEIYDGTTLGADLDADGFNLKTRELHSRFHGTAAASDALTALQPRPPFDTLETIYRQAARVAGRTTKERIPEISKDVLQQAALDVTLRTEESALDTDIASLIVKDTPQPQPPLPAELQSFAHLCTHLDAARRLDPAITPNLLLRGGKGASLGLSVQALASGMNAVLFAIPPTLAAALLAEKAGALGELLTEIDTYARRAHRQAVVHVPQLHSITAVAEELPAFAQFAMQTQLLGELQHPPHADRQHVVFVASADGEARLPDTLVQAFDTRVTLQAPGAREVQELVLQQLARGRHPHNLTPQALQRIGAKAEGLGTSEIETALHRAARLALKRQADCLSEADIVAGMGELRAERDAPPPYMAMYS